MGTRSILGGQRCVSGILSWYRPPATKTAREFCVAGKEWVQKPSKKGVQRRLGGIASGAEIFLLLLSSHIYWHRDCLVCIACNLCALATARSSDDVINMQQTPAPQ